MRKMRGIIAVFAVMLLAVTSVLSVDAAETSNTQVSTTVPDSHNIRVEKDHATVAFEEEETQDEEGISDNFTVDRFSEPTIHIEAEKGWKIKRILLNDQDVTDQLKNGDLTLEAVCEDMTLTIETEEITSPGQGKEQEKEKETPGAGKDIKNPKPKGKSLDQLKKWKAAVTGDTTTFMLYGMVMLLAVMAGVIVVRLRRRK